MLRQLRWGMGLYCHLHRVKLRGPLVASQFSSINTVQVSPVGPKSPDKAVLGADRQRQCLVCTLLCLVSQNVDDDDLIHSFGLASCLKVQSRPLDTKVGVGFD